MALPKKIKNFNTFIDGQGFAGIVTEAVLPKLARIMEDYRAGGMNAPIESDQGMEKLETELTFGEIVRSILEQFGICNASGVGMRFRAAVQSDSGDCSVDAVEVVMRGRFREMDFGSAKSGDETVFKVSGGLTYFKYMVNDEVIIEIDVLNMVEIVNGVDRLKEQRDAIGIDLGV